jgi:aminobenzoyl-glutamate utilization protein B
MKHSTFGTLKLIILVIISFPVTLIGQTNKSKARIYPEKQFVLDQLGKQATYEKFGKISDAIWSYAELGLQEFKSSALLSGTLEKAGFKVERGLAGMPTCFVATFGSGKPVVGILGEFDALPTLSQNGVVPHQDPILAGAPGHGCGHNTMCTAVSAAAIAVKEAMEKYHIKGTIKVFGSPAEETIISRPYMIKAGLFKDVDVIIDNHSSAGFNTSYGIYGDAVFSTIFTFKGKTAHSAVSPWSGRSALDAVEIMDVSTNFLREHLFYTERMHYVIIDGGEAPNVVPDKASVWYYIRNTDELILDMYERVLNCAKGAALATGTELAEVRVLTAVHQQYLNKAAAELYQKNIELVGMPKWTDEDQAFAKALQKELGEKEIGMPTKVDSIKPPAKTFVGGGSSDIGEVTLIAPTATILFPGNVPGSIAHHWSIVAAGKGSTAWKGLNAGAKAMAASAIDLLTQPDQLKIIREEFEALSKEHPYKSYLPDGATPPLDLNRDLMLKWRPLMEKNYLDPDK